tara:strand:+ start:315 stop:485 length:171 start_codon:yes stop_codon:yes gene_type:complete
MYELTGDNMNFEEYYELYEDQLEIYYLEDDNNFYRTSFESYCHECYRNKLFIGEGA